MQIVTEKYFKELSAETKFPSSVIKIKLGTPTEKGHHHLKIVTFFTFDENGNQIVFDKIAYLTK
jgi:hypothetical protein